MLYCRVSTARTEEIASNHFKMGLDTLIECPAQFEMVRGDFLGTCRTYSTVQHENINYEVVFF